MEITSILSVGIAVTLLNVWLLRINKATPYRGGQAQNGRRNLRFMDCLIGCCQWRCAQSRISYRLGHLALDAACTKPVALGIAALMLAAVLMHLKVSDGVKKCFPATLLMLAALLLGLGLS